MEPTAKDPEQQQHRDEEDVEARTSPSAAIVYETIRSEGEDELQRAPMALAWSGLAAGLSMGFSLVAEGLLHAALPDAAWRPLVVKFGYAVGFLIVILGRQQLFTENTLTPILPLLSSKKPLSVLPKVMRLWAIVLVANVVGTCCFAFILARTEILDPATRESLAHIAQKAMEGSGSTHLLRAIFAGWLIALLVWVLPFAESARVSVIIIITYFVGLGGFDHIVAGSTKAFYAVVMGDATIGAFFTTFWLPALAGNVIGGVLFVAAINHAQVVAGGNEDA